MKNIEFGILIFHFIPVTNNSQHMLRIVIKEALKKQRFNCLKLLYRKVKLFVIVLHIIQGLIFIETHIFLLVGFCKPKICQQ